MKEKEVNIYKTLNEYKKKLETLGYTVIYIGLYGSQNYNVDDEISDIDAKAIVMPTLHDIVFRKPVSRVIECDNGAIDVKDLITFYDVIRKGNFSYIESIQTKYVIGDKYIQELFKPIPVNFKSVVGAMYEKRKALTHEYPSKHEEFNKWGFDPKQWHHILRLYDLLHYDIRFVENYAYITYTDDDPMRTELIETKRNKKNTDIKYVENQCDILIDLAKRLIPEDYKYEPLNLENEIFTYIENKLKVDIRNAKGYYAREIRTFDNNISKKDIDKFPILKDYQGKDISYIVTEILEIL